MYAPLYDKGSARAPFIGTRALSSSSAPASVAAAGAATLSHRARATCPARRASAGCSAAAGCLSAERHGSYRLWRPDLSQQDIGEKQLRSSPTNRRRPQGCVAAAGFASAYGAAWWATSLVGVFSAAFLFAVAASYSCDLVLLATSRRDLPLCYAAATAPPPQNLQRRAWIRPVGKFCPPRPTLTSPARPAASIQ